MIEIKQKVVNKDVGDCFRACVASILEVNDIDSLPNPHGSNWIGSWFNALNEIGLRLGWDRDAILRDGYWIASVPSLNFKNVSHSIVMKGNKVEFDPSTKKTYRKGRVLFGKNIVTFGYWLELNDISKFKRAIFDNKSFLF